jgi:hypothetical protein
MATALIDVTHRLSACAEQSLTARFELSVRDEAGSAGVIKLFQAGAEAPVIHRDRGFNGWLGRRSCGLRLSFNNDHRFFRAAFALVRDTFGSGCSAFCGISGAGGRARFCGSSSCGRRCSGCDSSRCRCGCC